MNLLLPAGFDMSGFYTDVLAIATIFGGLLFVSVSIVVLIKWLKKAKGVL